MGVSRWIILWLSDWTGLKHLKKPLPARKREAKWILCLLYHIMLCWYYRGGDTCKCSIKSGHTRMSQRSQHVGQQDNVTFYFLFIADMFDKGCSSVQHCFILHSTRKKEKRKFKMDPHKECACNYTSLTEYSATTSFNSICTAPNRNIRYLTRGRDLTILQINPTVPTISTQSLSSTSFHQKKIHNL